MANRSGNRNSRATTPSPLPTPDFIEEAKRARGKALRDMLLAFVKWARSPHGASAGTSPGAMRVSPKR